MPSSLLPVSGSASHAGVPSCELTSECDRDLRARTLTTLLAALPSSSVPWPSPLDNHDTDISPAVAAVGDKLPKVALPVMSVFDVRCVRDEY